jgi:CHAD domain-containing protein
MPVSTSRSALLRKHLDRFTRMLPGVEQGDVTSLHRARVASRRLRELLPTLQLEHPAAVRKLGRRLRKVTTRLGTVRELDVLVLLVDELHVSRRDRSSAVGRVGVAVARKRDEARKHLFERLPIAEMRRIARKLDSLADQLDTAEEPGSKVAARSWRWVVEARIARRATRLTTAIDHAGGIYVPDRLHAVRIAIKKLRYAVELSTEIAGQKTDATLRALTRGQDLLGRVHDIQVLIDRVRKVQASLVPPNVTVWRELDALIVSLEDDCRRLHARYMRARDPLVALVARLADVERARSAAVRSPETRAAG